MLRDSLQGPTHAADKSTRLCSLEERDTLHTRPTPQPRGSPAPHRAGCKPRAPAATLPGTGRLSGWDHRAAPVAARSGRQQPLRNPAAAAGASGPRRAQVPCPAQPQPPQGGRGNHYGRRGPSKAVGTEDASPTEDRTAPRHKHREARHTWTCKQK